MLPCFVPQPSIIFSTYHPHQFLFSLVASYPEPAEHAAVLASPTAVILGLLFSDVRSSISGQPRCAPSGFAGLKLCLPYFYTWFIVWLATDYSFAQNFVKKDIALLFSGIHCCCWEVIWCCDFLSFVCHLLFLSECTQKNLLSLVF